MGVEEVDIGAPAYVVGDGGEVGLVLAHGGEADGRHFFLDEATDLARFGATVGLAKRASDWFEQLSPSRAAYLAAVERWEAARLLARPGKRRLLVQAARFDDNVPLEAARDAYESAAHPKEWREYDCDHGAVVVHPAARADRRVLTRELAW